MSMLTSESLNPNLVEDDPYSLSLISKGDRTGISYTHRRDFDFSFNIFSGILTRQDRQKEVLHDGDNTLPLLDVLVIHPMLLDDDVQSCTHSADMLRTRRQDLSQHQLLLFFLRTQRRRGRKKFTPAFKIDSITAQ